jgi:uncharacterized protein YbjT (DUF2867 family)
MIVIIGATGTVGKEAVRLLLDAGHEVTAVTRNPSGAAFPEGVRVVAGDPSQPQTLSSVWQGTDAVLLSPRAVGPAAADLLSYAATQHVRRVTVISAATVEYPVGEPRFVAGFKAVESAAQDSGLAWTFLRCADFSANALAWAPQIRAAGAVRAAYPDAATSPIHQQDIAEVAVAALTGPDHEGQSYVLTGPESLTQRDKVRLIGEAVGQDLSFTEVEPDAVRAGMIAQGLPEEIPARLLGSLADYAREPGPTTDTVSKLLGRPALSFATWASENAAAFQN